MANQHEIALVFVALGVLAPEVAAQHRDVLAFDAGGKIGIGEFSFDSGAATASQVFVGRLDSFYSVNDPGFSARPELNSLPGNTDVQWDFLPMTVDSGLHSGYVSTLLYWDGTGNDPIFGPTPTDDYRFSLVGENGAVAAGGTDEMVFGKNIGTTEPNGFMDAHRFFFLDDNLDPFDDNLPPDAGIYLFSMQLRAAGLDTSDPFFLVWATPEASVVPAIQPAVDWVNARVETLVVDDTLLPGDFNLDGIVDAADYTVWRDGLGTTYQPADYDLWVANYGATSPPATSFAVPEPSAMVMMLIGCVGVAGTRPIWRRPCLAQPL